MTKRPPKDKHRNPDSVQTAKKVAPQSRQDTVVKTDVRPSTATIPNPAATGMQGETIQRGRVSAYHVTEKELIIKIDVSAIHRYAAYVPTDAPWYRSALSIAMLAYNERTREGNAGLAYPAGTVWLRLAETLPEDEPAGSDDRALILRAVAIGQGLNDPFEIADWSRSPNWI